MRIEDRGLIYDAADKPDSGKITCFTSLCPTDAGDLYCSFQRGPAKHAVTSTVGICRSVDSESTWQELPARFESTLDGVPGSLAGGEMIEAEPGRLLLFSTWFDRSEPERPLFDPETEGILRSKQLMAVSTDGGDSWSNWQVLDMHGLTGCALTGPPVKWADGTIAFAFESFKEFDDPKPGRHAAWVMVSRDGGRSFEAPTLIAQHPEHRLYYWDQRLCVGDHAGEYYALFWTHDLQRKQDLHVHFRHGTIDTAGSHADISETSIRGQIAAPLLLPDGRLLAFVVDRNPPCTMKLWFSSDGGRSWPESDYLVVYTHDEQAALSQGAGADNVDFAQYWEDMGKWSFGHPAIRSLGDGKVLLAHYAGTPDRMSVHWIRVAS